MTVRRSLAQQEEYRMRDGDAAGRGTETTEQRAIFAAHQYAKSNGYAPDDRRAAGLVLVGMAMAAGCSPAARDAIRRGYLAAHPNSAAALSSWAEFLSEGES